MLCTQRMDELFGLIDPAPDSLVASLACICNPMKLAHYPKSWVPSNCPYWQHEHGMPKSEDGPKYFNSGMMVLHPNTATFNRLVKHFQAESDLSRYPFPDQDFLNEMFPNFKVASYKYNAVKTLRRAHPGVWNMEEVKNVHYILTKPWDVVEHPDDEDDIRDDGIRPTSHDDGFHDLYRMWWRQRDTAVL
ncbi:Aste57867_6081 [Aphanomyces stellatus]|uniref:Aste57867_6081 protein n=1 Tax=Aphanomyces stellatus TaxID=120398 RepID=A0A485KH31_9STRA|nr:hypothetical protein As57867_006067 [Aphanomyces stellatus]VFT83090.1 Aste57867_6081 [Aphanomyces stellatus]